MNRILFDLYQKVRLTRYGLQKPWGGRIVYITKIHYKDDGNATNYPHFTVHHVESGEETVVRQSQLDFRQRRR